MSKSDRQKIFEKFGGRCAYCGCELQKGWPVDHIVPVFRNDTDEQFERRITHGENKSDTKRGTDEVENYNPSCRRCNTWKATLSIEQFRNEISEQVKRARLYSCNFRMAEDYRLIAETHKQVLFYFEKHELKQYLDNFSANYGR